MKKDAEIAQLKQKHNEEVTSLKSGMDGLRHIVRVLAQRCDIGMSPEEVEALLQFAQCSPHDANSAPGLVGHHNPHSSGSTHVPNQEMVSSCIILLSNMLYLLVLLQSKLLLLFCSWVLPPLV